MFKYIKDKLEHHKARKNVWKIHDIVVKECHKNEYGDLRINIGNIARKYMYYYYKDTDLDNMYLVVLDEIERKEALEAGVPGLIILTLNQYRDCINNEFKRIPKTKVVTYFSMSPTLYGNVEARSIYANRPITHRHWWWRNNE